MGNINFVPNKKAVVCGSVVALLIYMILTRLTIQKKGTNFLKRAKESNKVTARMSILGFSVAMGVGTSLLYTFVTRKHDQQVDMDSELDQDTSYI